MAIYERHPTRKGVYLAYDARGFAFRCFRDGKIWRGHRHHASDRRLFRADTLNALAALIGESA